MKRNIILYLLLLCSIGISAQDIVVPPRTCTVCKETKPVSEFSGDSKTCKACAKKKSEIITCSSCKKSKALNAFSRGSKVCRTCAAPIMVTAGDYVDLGLPSGTLWATRNVGASSPEDYGDYFAWGETQGYNSGKYEFSWKNYKWGEYSDLTKYCVDSPYGSWGKYDFIDDRTELYLEDDAAYVNWGSNWRMPNVEQMIELTEKCVWIWTDYKGVKGYLVRGRNGKSIFLPAAGFWEGSTLRYAGEGGDYWTRSLYKVYPYEAFRLYGNMVQKFINQYRSYGRSVRPIYITQLESERIAREQTETEEKKSIARQQAEREGCVDLGLPSGTLWATYNVGATRPEECGDYFSWGETKPKKDYSWATYKWCNGSSSSLTKYNSSSDYGTVDNKKELDLEDDAAYVNWGSNWRMPGYIQLEELRRECSWEPKTINGVNGFKVIGPNGKSIFLPTAGYRDDMSINGIGYTGNYWLRSYFRAEPNNAYGLGLSGGRVYFFNRASRCEGKNVRPVWRKKQ